jgi:hypothetical protein
MKLAPFCGDVAKLLLVLLNKLEMVVQQQSIIITEQLGGYYMISLLPHE